MPMSGVIESNSLAGTAVLLKGSRITMTAVHGINTTGAAAYIQLFDAATAGAVTLGTTVPRWVLTMAASNSATDRMPGDGLVFDNGIVAASTNTATGSTGATAHCRVAHL